MPLKCYYKGTLRVSLKGSIQAGRRVSYTGCEDPDRDYGLDAVSVALRSPSRPSRLP